MKHLKTAPTNTIFFEVYAKLAKSIRSSGIFAQIVSALTEIGGIYAASYSALLPIFPAGAIYIAGVVALIGTAVIELGLRVLAPHSVDAILYRRFKGLHLPMTIAIWLLTIVLLATSGLLSFRNSKVIVNEFTPETEQLNTFEADSILKSKTALLAASYRTDSTTIAQRWESLITTQKEADKSNIQSAKRELSNLYNKEKRTGRSFATLKDKTRQKRADLEAAAATNIAEMEAAKAYELREAQNTFKAELSKAEKDHRTTTQEVKTTNVEAEKERAATVNGYGYGLGWFTVICLFVFLAAVILERIHHKGSGIMEKVELSQYDLNPGSLTEAWTALTERWNYALHSRINTFAEKTPAAPLPTAKAELYDPTQVANISVTLKIERVENENEQIIYIEPKRRQIGFKTDQQTNTNAKPKNGKKREISPNSCAVKEQDKLNLSDLTQRLKMYNKRLGKHQQKVIKLEKAGKQIPKRTADAITNNKKWVEHYTELIRQAKEIKSN